MRIRKWYFGLGLQITVSGTASSIIEHVLYPQLNPLSLLVVDILPVIGIIILVWKGIDNEERVR